MPYAQHGSLHLYYESTGSGPPVLLIMGQGMTCEAGWRTVDRLSRDFRVLAFDNRDVGRSEHSAWPYTVSQMAHDAVAVLDAAGEPRAHVYGISLGGMVAQELALHYPERVMGLVLGATAAGGSSAVPSDTDALTFFTRVGAMGSEEAEWAAVPYSYGLATRRLHAQRIADDIERRIPHAPETLGYLHQVAAAVTHATNGRLEHIRAPTMVVHGEEDRIMAPENARQLAERIPSAVLRMWPGAGHMYVTDEPRADRAIARFLRQHSVAATLDAAA